MWNSDPNENIRKRLTVKGGRFFGNFCIQIFLLEKACQAVLVSNYISTKDFLLILVFHDATIKLISYKKEE